MQKRDLPARNAVRYRSIHWASIGVALLGVAACRQLVGIDDEPHAPPGAGGVDASSEAAAAACGDFPWSAGSCEACMQSACCTEATTCRGDATCATAFDCVAKCAAGDELCRAACVTRGDGAMTALGSCQASSCASACGLQCGGWGLLAGPVRGSVTASKSCQACLTAPALCGQLAACMGDRSCLAVPLCADNCLPLDQDCHRNCEYPDPLPSGFVTLKSLFLTGASDQDDLCQAECQFGSNWSCVGSVIWPESKTSTITYSLQVLDFGDTNKPLAGVTAKACAKLDASCSSPLTKPPFATTDANGVASLTIPLTDASPYFDGYVELTKADYIPVLQFTYPYLAVSSAPRPALLAFAQMIPTSLKAVLGGAIGTTLDDALGVFSVQPVDCEGNLASGVSFSGSPLGPAAKAFYLVDNLPNAQATSTNVQPGTVPGGGFVNVAPGLVTVVASAAGKRVSTVTLLVRAGAFTQAELAPTN